MLDGLGVNYNTAMSMDGLHATYPDKFFFCSETSSEDVHPRRLPGPAAAQHGRELHPGQARHLVLRQQPRLLDDERGVRAQEGPRPRVLGRAGSCGPGQDYIGEPTPYDVFPVKASFFGAIDTAGFPKDAYYLFKSQWTTAPMVHIVPMNWTDYTPGQHVAVWVYANVATVELFLNGTSLGREIVRPEGHHLRAAVPGDDRAHRGRLQLSVRQLHEPQRQHRQAPPDLERALPARPAHRRAPRGMASVVARDEIHTAGQPQALTLTPDAQVDRRGRDVPGRSWPSRSPTGRRGGPERQQPHPVRRRRAGHAGRRGQRPAGERAELPGVLRARLQRQGAGYRPVNRGKPGQHHGHRDLPRAGRGQRHATLGAAAGTGSRGRRIACRRRRGGCGPGRSCCRRGEPGQRPTADASYSGAPDTVPAAMLDGDLTTGWSNYYNKAATANLRAVSVSHASDWVSVSWPDRQEFSADHGLLHAQRRRWPSRLDRGVVLGRPGLRAGARTCQIVLGHRVQPADHAHLRRGPQQPGQAGP